MGDPIIKTPTETPADHKDEQMRLVQTSGLAGETKEKFMRLAGLLTDMLKEKKRLLIAFSGGADSTFLLFAAYIFLPGEIAAVTFDTPLQHRREIGRAAAYAQQLDIPHIIVRDADPLTIDGFAANPPERCYLCKRMLCSRLTSIARQHGFTLIADGSNQDDLSAYRPGARALREFSIISPLQQAGLTKSEIRQLSRLLQLPTHDLPSAACLASRFPYGETMTAEKLAMVREAEEFLQSLGFSQLRVRLHKDLARIEVLPQEIGRLLEPELRPEIERRFRQIGFAYTTADLRGFRSGSLDETLTDKSDRSDNGRM